MDSSYFRDCLPPFINERRNTWQILANGFDNPIIAQLQGSKYSAALKSHLGPVAGPYACGQIAAITAGHVQVIGDRGKYKIGLLELVSGIVPKCYGTRNTIFLIQQIIG